MCNFLTNGLTEETADEFQKNKIEWLKNSDYGDKSKNSYWIDLDVRVHQYEVALGRDLYQFSKVEIENIIKAVATTSHNTVKKLFSTINAYIQYTVDIGKNYVGNPCDQIIVSEIIDVNVNVLKDEYKTILEFHNFVLGLKCSDVDKMTLLLLRYGCKIRDLSGLKWDNIDKERMVLKLNRDNIELPIDNVFLLMLEQAKRCYEYEYVSKYERVGAGGELKEVIRTVYIEYADDEYIVKQQKGAKNEIIGTASIYTRINNICKNNDINRINLNILKNMRAYDLLYYIYNKNDKLTNEDAKNVCKTLDGNNIDADGAGFRLRESFSLISGIKFSVK
ncbi:MULTISPECIES: hypothetical protein [unclassified Clostridium]|uniref:phage lytic cycle repressor MrpR family protein n=1 Tax=unclassified Clostridium TaxID=2614128 RepID=UPI0020792A9E|nr:MULTISPECIES: hypothetical protein [unclassified Clostridium]